MAFTSQNIFPFNLYLHITGTLGWLFVAIKWKDRSLIVLNVVALYIFMNGIIAIL